MKFRLGIRLFLALALIIGGGLAIGGLHPAHAACTLPDGAAGDIIFNVDHKVLQYCNDTDWIGFPKNDNTPNAFVFTDLTNQTQSALVSSNIVTILGLDSTANVSIGGDGSPAFRINSGSWVTSGVVSSGDTLQLRMTTSSSVGTQYTASVTVGSVTVDWNASTIGADTTPAAFNFTDQTGVAVSTVITSNSINITGINTATPVSVSGAGSPQIRIAGGSWVTSGTISNGQSLQVRLTSSASNSTMLSATVDVGGVTNQWDVTTTSGLPYFTGGTVVESGGYRIHTFTSSGTFTMVSPGDVEYLVVAGGGGGGRRTNNHAGGGGGGGGVLSGSVSISATQSITVGAGGTGATSDYTSGQNGGNSTIGALVTALGGGGGSGTVNPAPSGGSGGGGFGSQGSQSNNGGSGTAGQGHAGGKGNNNSGASVLAGGGGGGAGAVGQNGTAGKGGNGGIGVSSSISGSSTYYGGGGGGGAYTQGTGGTGGGGEGGQSGSRTGKNATDGTGGGGGGPFQENNAGNGGSGIVIIRYPL